jgi:hypothetical protein
LWNQYHPVTIDGHWEDVQKFINGITNNCDSAFSNEYYKSIMYYFNTFNINASGDGITTITGLLPGLFSGDTYTYTAGRVVHETFTGLGQIYTIENPVSSWMFN